MGLKTLYAKTGLILAAPSGEEVTGANTSAMPTADTADAKGLTLYHGLHPNEIYEVIVNRNAADILFALEASLDGTNFSRISFRRLDTDAVISGASGLTFGASARVLISLAQPNQHSRLMAVRPSVYLLGADASADAWAVVRVRNDR